MFKKHSSRSFAGSRKAPIRTLAQMIAAAGFKPEHVSPNIAERNFPLENEGLFYASGLELYNYDCQRTIAEMEALIKPDGGRFEGLVRGLAYISANPDALKDGAIIFPGSSWMGPGGHKLWYPYAGLNRDGLWLDLGWGGHLGHWPPCRFLYSK